MMTESSIPERISEVVRTTLGLGKETEINDLQSVLLDSFRMVELTLAIEDEFSISIPDEKLSWAGINSVDQLTELVSDLLET